MFMKVINLQENCSFIMKTVVFVIKTPIFMKIKLSLYDSKNIPGNTLLCNDAKNLNKQQLIQNNQWGLFKHEPFNLACPFSRSMGRGV